MGLLQEVADYKRERLMHYLQEAGGNVSRASELARVNRQHFHHLMAAAGIKSWHQPHGPHPRKPHRGMVWRHAWP